MTDLTQKCILKSYSLMKAYLHSDDLEDEECFSKMFNEISQMKIAIPKNVYEKIEAFIIKELSPIVYDNILYTEIKTPKYGFYNHHGIFEFHSEEKAKKACILIYKKLFEIEEQLDEFGKKELSTYLL